MFIKGLDSLANRPAESKEPYISTVLGACVFGRSARKPGSAIAE